MLRIVAIAAAAAGLAGCMNTAPVSPDEFTPHGRFSADPKERAFAECGAQAMVEQDRANRGPGGNWYSGRRAAVVTLSTCMNAKGYAWSTPR